MNYCSKKDIWFQGFQEYKYAILEDSYVRYDYFLNNNYHIISFNVLKLWTLHIYIISKSKHIPRPWDQFTTMLPLWAGTDQSYKIPPGARGAASFSLPHHWTLISQICLFPLIDLGRIFEISNTYLYIHCIYWNKIGMVLFFWTRSHEISSIFDTLSSALLVSLFLLMFSANLELQSWIVLI